MTFCITYTRETSHFKGECMVGKLTLRLVFDWVGSVNGTTSNQGIKYR